MRHSTDNLGPKSLLAPSVIEPSLPGQLVCSARPRRRLPACGLGTAGLAVDLPTIAGGADHHLLVAEGARVDPVSILNRRRHCLTPGLDSRGDSGHTPLGSSDLNRRENPKRPKVCNNARVSFLFPAKGSSTPPSGGAAPLSCVLGRRALASPPPLRKKMDGAARRRILLSGERSSRLLPRAPLRHPTCPRLKPAQLRLQPHDPTIRLLRSLSVVDTMCRSAFMRALSTGMRPSLLNSVVCAS